MRRGIRNREGGNLLLRVANLLLISTTIISALLLVITILAQYINPNSLVLPAFVALVAPVIIFVNIILFLFWIIRWRVWALISALPLIFALGYVDRFYQLSVVTEYEHGGRRPSDELSVLSYNVFCFNRFHQGGSSMDSILTKIQSVSPDLVCFQEFYIKDSASINQIEYQMSDYPHHIYMKQKNAKLTGYVGPAIFSKFPIVNSEFSTYNESPNGYIIADILHNSDTVKVITCHLQGTEYNRVSNNMALGEIMEIDTTREVVGKIVDAFSKNFKVRASQADSLRMIMDSSLYPVLVAGDFNSTPMNYTYSTIRGELEDAFEAKGEGYASTYRPMMGLVRIDYVLYDPRWYDALSYDALDWSYSDHKAVLVNLKMREQETD